MSYRSVAIVLPALLLVGGFIRGAEPDPPAIDESPPLDSSLVERTERRLVQLDVSLSPKKKKHGDAVIPQLNTDDLELVINGKRIDIRYADRLCKAVESKLPAEIAAVEPASPDVPKRAPDEIPARRGAYLFYFEHSHLTMEGQENALVMAEEMIPKLVGSGTRGMIGSSGRALRQSELTDSPDELLEFLKGIRHDPLQWGEVAYAEGEWERYADIFGMQTLESGGGGAIAPVAVGPAIDRAKRRALMHAREELLRTNRQLRRFAAVLGSFADLKPPKAALYFADIIRKNAGQHYAALFSNVSRSPDTGGAPEVGVDPLREIVNDAFASGLTFDKVTEQAAAHGIRLYTIRARGLELGISTMQRSGYTLPDQMPMPDRGMRDADETMVSFALETGGASYRGGTESSTINKVLKRIRADLTCFYLLSFYPDDLPEDSLLPVRVRFDVDGARYAELEPRWEIGNRGQLLVQSEAKRQEAILLAAHTNPDAIDAGTARTVLIPLGYTGDEYQALAQFVVDSPQLPGELSPATTWDLGMSLVSRDKVRHRASRRLEVGATGVPVVLEASWSFPPGPGEIVAVGFEHRFGQLAAVDIETDWPDPKVPAASITPIAVLQPADRAFLRVDSAGAEPPRTDGTLAIGDGAARLDRPIYFVGLVCRGKRSRDLWIDRKLVGDTTVDFGLQAWSDAEEERCVQIRDLIRPGQAGWGDFRYKVRVYDNASLVGEPLAEKVRLFTGLDGGSG